MKTMHASLLALALAGIMTAGASSALSAKEITVGIASTFTTMDPYDAGDTLSQTAAKSMYEGLFGLDKDMKIRNVLAESYDVSADGSSTRSISEKASCSTTARNFRPMP